MGNNNNQIIRHGVKCDTPTCDYTVELNAFEEYVPYINKACPKCGANLLTEDDYKLAETYHKLSTDEEFAKEFEEQNFISKLPKEITDMLEKIQDAQAQALIRVEFVDGVPKMTSEDPEVQGIISAIDNYVESEKQKFNDAVNLARNN